MAGSLGKVDMTTLELLKSEFERRDADVCQRLPERRQLQYRPQPCLQLAPCRFCQGS